MLRRPGRARALVRGAGPVLGAVLSALAALLPAGAPTPSPTPFSSPSPSPTPRPPARGLLAAVCYHRFGVESPKDPYRISLGRLAGQLRWLRANHWTGVSLTQVAAALDGDTRALPPKAILLSVDDGYRAGAMAAPVFRRYGFRAVYFVVPAVLGKGSFLSYGELRDLEARGFEIGCHTLTHPDLAKVPGGMRPAGYVRWVAGELGRSKGLLEAALGHPVDALAWPYGAYNPDLAAAALRLGYRQLWSVSGGLNDQAALDRSRLRRIILMGHPPLETFARRLRQLPVAPFAGGIAEGSLIYRSELPRRVLVPRGFQAALGGKPVVLDRGGGFVLGRRMHGGFHYLNVAEEDGRGNRLTPFLFQVAPDAWRPCFQALSAVAAAAAPVSPAAKASPAAPPAASVAPASAGHP